MINQRFGYFSEDGTILSGKVKEFSWDKTKTTIVFHLILDKEPDADIEYSACINSSLHVDNNTVIITNDGCWLPFDSKGIPTNSLEVNI